jgi:hypothetical protein
VSPSVGVYSGEEVELILPHLDDRVEVAALKVGVELEPAVTVRPHTLEGLSGETLRPALVDVGELVLPALVHRVGGGWPAA